MAALCYCAMFPIKHIILINSSLFYRFFAMSHIKNIKSESLHYLFFKGIEQVNSMGVVWLGTKYFFNARGQCFVLPLFALDLVFF